MGEMADYYEAQGWGCFDDCHDIFRFFKGDRVKYSNGSVHYTVTSVIGRYVGIKSDASGQVFTAHQNKLKFITGKEEEEYKMQMKKGATVKVQTGGFSTTTYGEFVAYDGSQIVVKVGNEYKAYSHCYVEEVLPYTVSLKFLGGNTHTEYHYCTDKGSVAVGDVVFVKNTTGWATITGVDTKSRKATKRLDATVYTETRGIS